MKPFSITPINKKLLKSSKVRAWLIACEALVKAEMEKNGAAWWPQASSKVDGK